MIKPLRIKMIAILMSLVPIAVTAQPVAGVVVKEAEIRQVVEHFIQGRAAGLGVELNVKKIGYSGDLSLPAGQVEYEVKAPHQWEGWGSASLALYVRVDGQVRRNIPIRVEVEALSEMVVTARPLEQGEVIGVADVALQKRDLSVAGGKICRRIDDVVGKRLKATLRGNAPIRADQLEKVPLVKSGQLVTIVVENDFIRGTASGRSRGGGAAGDVVMVQNLVSQKDVPARVVDAATVKVEF